MLCKQSTEHVLKTEYFPTVSPPEHSQPRKKRPGIALNHVHRIRTAMFTSCTHTHRPHRTRIIRHCFRYALNTHRAIAHFKISLKHADARMHMYPKHEHTPGFVLCAVLQSSRQVPRLARGCSRAPQSMLFISRYVILWCWG